MTDEPEKIDEHREELPLSKAAQYLVEECRMVLPGIQALFGFQLTVVFHPGFSEKLTSAEQRLHFIALTLLGIAIALIMTPAAYHRQTGPQEVTSKFIRLASGLLLSSMAPLAFGICIDFYLVGHVISKSVLIPVLASGLFAFIVILWFVLPRIALLKKKRQ
ncbi:DUF6328 family protein [Pedosphaera parvula]|uniref:Integral membrane protein n=1 Tax=Pedosphaera parvula (strain Ellin514) TaxID=320771 RepID=B9XRX5_PEDPL|nr:DUF6328 family protein [Pedosphaera parvula]EEF57434.1 conserved hypothetical protein [Pedosphaera parvula Ellin514]